MRRFGTKTHTQKEDAEVQRLSRPVPSKKPPRQDLRRNRMTVNDPDIAPKGVAGDPDLSLNYKKVAHLYVAKIMRLAADEDDGGEEEINALFEDDDDDAGEDFSEESEGGAGGDFSEGDEDSSTEDSAEGDDWDDGFEEDDWDDQFSGIDDVGGGDDVGEGGEGDGPPSPEPEPEPEPVDEDQIRADIKDIVKGLDISENIKKMEIFELEEALEDWSTYMGLLQEGTKGTRRKLSRIGLKTFENPDDLAATALFHKVLTDATGFSLLKKGEVPNFNEERAVESLGHFKCMDPVIRGVAASSIFEAINSGGIEEEEGKAVLHGLAIANALNGEDTVTVGGIVLYHALGPTFKKIAPAIEKHKADHVLARIGKKAVFSKKGYDALRPVVLSLTDGEFAEILYGSVLFPAVRTLQETKQLSFAERNKVKEIFTAYIIFWMLPLEEMLMGLGDLDKDPVRKEIRNRELKDNVFASFIDSLCESINSLEVNSNMKYRGFENPVAIILQLLACNAVQGMEMKPSEVGFARLKHLCQHGDLGILDAEIENQFL